MKLGQRNLNRRAFLGSMATLGAAVSFVRSGISAASYQARTKAIPSTGERIPVIGMGSWITFSVGDEAALRAEVEELLSIRTDREVDHPAGRELALLFVAGAATRSIRV